MGYETVLFERNGTVATITLNRPQAMNAITWKLMEEFGQALEECEGTAGIRAVILTGSGRGFCAGADVTDLSTRSGNAAVRYLYELADRMHERGIRPIRRMGKPVIGAINGVAAGAGLGLVLACDMSATIPEAKFMMAYSKMGICPDCGVSYFLPRLVGPARAMELYLLNEPLSGRQAHEMGLVNRLVSKEDLLPVAQELANLLAQGPTAAYAQAKRLFDDSFRNGLEAHLREEALGVGNCAATDDHLEAVAAFGAKRMPHFHGH